MRHRLSILALVALATFALSGAASSTTGSAGNSVVRWDITSVAHGVVFANGTSVSTASASGDTLTLTGTGDAQPSDARAAGGGHFVHRTSDGTVLARGYYTATRFVSWQDDGGALPLVDAIGARPQASAGVLKLGVTFFVHGQPAAHGLLTITCALPGNTGTNLEEGVQAAVRPVGSTLTIKFDEKEPDNGPTLFHVIPD